VEGNFGNPSEEIGRRGFSPHFLFPLLLSIEEQNDRKLTQMETH